MSSIVTKTGDSGMTSISGMRVRKYDPRIKVNSQIDHLSSYIGAVLSLPSSFASSSPSSSLCEEDSKEKECVEPEVAAYLNHVQFLLYKISAAVAKYSDDVNYEEEIKDIEEIIRILDERLLPLKNFIAAGGCGSATYLHLARTQCRLLEIEMWQLHDSICTGEYMHFIEKIIYINRLSDFLFIAARYENFKKNIPDVKMCS